MQNTLIQTKAERTLSPCSLATEIGYNCLHMTHPPPTQQTPWIEGNTTHSIHHTRLYHTTLYLIHKLSHSLQRYGPVYNLSIRTFRWSIIHIQQEWLMYWFQKFESFRGRWNKSWGGECLRCMFWIKWKN